MKLIPFHRGVLSEFIGTAILLATVIGSGVMGEQLAGGNTALALLGNTIATGAVLFVLITILGPLSGAHFNPAVSFAMGVTGRLPWPRVGSYVVAQVAGGLIGVWLAHAMFDLPLLEVSTKQRWGTGQWIAEAVATFGLLLTIFGGLRFNAPAMPALVGFYITAAYWFTASTSFANPAVTIARAWSNTFAGIAPASAVPFIIAQSIGAALALGVSAILFESEKRPNP